ncbi:MAG: NUDIX domain-containing protein [Bacillota bacterium]
MDWESRVTTAGAFVWNDGRLVFMVGPTRSGDRLGVVRLGGHREEGESSLECALREVKEEASLAAELLRPPVTYYAGTPLPLPGRPLPTIDWPGATPPVLVTERADGSLAAIYLAVSHGQPAPAAEAEGLLLPDRAWLSRLCARPYTLREYEAGGGRAILRMPMSPVLPLEPSPQLRLFARILTVHTDLVPA